MAITLTATKIKKSFYLLIPKSIVELVDFKDDTQFFLTLKKVRNKYILEYSIGKPK